jgi:hypothetical protein
MLFHVTITHRQEDCPGRRPAETPDLIGPADRLGALSNELSVKSHSVVWGASCILWAEPEHVAYALLEAPSLEAVERYIGALTPAAWATRALPVFTLPTQLAMVRQLLAVPVIPGAQSVAPVAEPVDDIDNADTLKGLTVGSVEPMANQSPPLHEAPLVAPVPPRDQGPEHDSGAVTRFAERPAILHDSTPPLTDQPEACRASTSDNEPYPASESATIILDPRTQGTGGLRLLANTGPAHGTVFDVGDAGATLGRLPENSICLTDGRLSRHHARIEFRDGEYWVNDLGSQNGTLVNDQPLTAAHRLQAGDSIELGTTRLTVILDPDD